MTNENDSVHRFQVMRALNRRRLPGAHSRNLAHLTSCRHRVSCILRGIKARHGFRWRCPRIGATISHCLHLQTHPALGQYRPQTYSTRWNEQAVGAQSITGALSQRQEHGRADSLYHTRDGWDSNNSMPKYQLSLYVNGSTIRGQRAAAQVREVCDDYFGNECELKVIDVMKDPAAAEKARILATPTLVRESPPPVCRIVGDMTNTRRMLEMLDVPQKDGEAKTGGEDAHRHTP